VGAYWVRGGIRIFLGARGGNPLLRGKNFSKRGGGGQGGGFWGGGAPFSGRVKKKIGFFFFSTPTFFLVISLWKKSMNSFLFLA